MGNNFDAKAFAENLIGGQVDGAEGAAPDPVPEDTHDDTVAPPDSQPENRNAATPEDVVHDQGGQQSEPDHDTSTHTRSKDDEGTEPGDQSQQTVPLPVVVQQRQEISQLKSALQQVYGELQRIQQHQQQPRQNEPVQEDLSFKPTVKFEEDPTQFLYEQNSWLQRQMGLVAQHVQGLYQNGIEQRQQQEHMTKQQRQEQEFKNYVQSVEHAYASQNPNYQDAVVYLRGKRLAELEGQVRAVGRDPKDPAISKELRNHVVNEFTNFARSVVQQQGDPAAALYQYATEVGFKPNGKAVDPAHPAPPQNTQYDRVKRGQEASMSAASMPGNAPSGGQGGEAQQQEDSFGSIAEALRRDLYGKHTR